MAIFKFAIWIHFFLLSESTQAKKKAMKTPWEWTSYEWDDWLIVKQINSSTSDEKWIDLFLNKSRYSYQEVSVESDTNGYPIVILFEKNEKYFLKLTDDMAYYGDVKTNVTNQFYAGYWVKKQETCNSYLPNKCKYIDFKRVEASFSSGIDQNAIICDNGIFDDEFVRSFTLTWQGCKRLRKSNIQLSIRPSSRHQIVNESFDVFKLTKYLPSLVYPVSLSFLSVKGFDIESRIKFKLINHLMFHTDFNLYKENRLVKGCQDFLLKNSIERSRGFIFRNNLGIIDSNNYATKYFINLTIFKPKNVHPICSLFFRHARIDRFNFNYMAKSYYLNNIVWFSDPNQTLETRRDEELNSTINILGVLDSYGYDLNSKLLNPKIFSLTRYFKFAYFVNSIDENVFAALTSTRQIFFNPLFFIKLIRKQGIEWLKRINSDLNVDLSNDTELDKHRNRVVLVNMLYERDYVLDPSGAHLAYDSDFCLFDKYPFAQMVSLSEGIDYGLYKNTTSDVSFTCTELWLYKFYNQFSYFNRYFSFIKYKLDGLNFSGLCHFEHRLNLCDKTNFNIKQALNQSSTANRASSLFSIYDLFVVLELALLIATPLLATYAILNNSIAVYVILNESNKSLTREKHYTYMCLHCICNALVGFVQFLDLMSTCPSAVSLFCSPIRQSIGVQYVKIVLGEFFNSAARLCSNLTYLGFSLCRMSKVGKEHGKFVTFMADRSVTLFMIVSVLASLGLSVSKLLQFDINLDMPNYAFPLPLIQNQYRLWLYNSAYVAIVVLCALYDLVNYFVFVCVHLFVDLILITKLKQVLREKEDKMREMTMQAGLLEKVLAENGEKKRRVILMVIYSFIFNLVTKLPSMVTSLNDVRLIITLQIPKQKYLWYVFTSTRTSLSFRYFCQNQRSCVILQQFGNCLYLLSLCSTLHFLKRFDNNFKLAYRHVFSTTPARNQSLSPKNE